MSDMNMTNERASFQAIFALDIITAAGALILLGLASKPTFQRIKARRFTSTDKSHGTPLKTALGTYLFLWPALFFLLVAYTARFVLDLLQTNGFIAYDSELTLNGRPSYSISYSPYGTSASTLSFLTALTTIFFTVLQTGGVWIHSSHIQSNGTGRTAPNTVSRIWNAFIMLSMLATGLAAWGLGMTKRDTTLGSLSSLARLSWSNILNHEDDVRAIYIVHQCIVVAASLSVTGQVLKEYSTTNKTARGSTESKHLARFAFVVVPLIWLRDIFIIYDIALLYLDTSAWSSTGRLVTTFLLIIFGQFANLFILAVVLWGAWRMGRTVNIFGSGSVA